MADASRNRLNPRRDNRKYRRFRVQLPAQFYLQQYRDLSLTAVRDKAGEGMVTNLSPGGLELLSPLHLPSGMEISLAFALPDAGDIEVGGRITWGRPGQTKHTYGITFTAITPVDGQRLGLYISARTNREHKISAYLKTWFSRI